jgi:hypothetical protein
MFLACGRLDEMTSNSYLARLVYEILGCTNTIQQIDNSKNAKFSLAHGERRLTLFHTHSQASRPL